MVVGTFSYANARRFDSRILDARNRQLIGKSHNYSLVSKDKLRDIPNDAFIFKLEMNASFSLVTIIITSRERKVDNSRLQQ